MALEGNLKDFSLADMFRLLASGSKSGALHVEGDRGEGLVCFKDGEVFFASSGGDGRGRRQAAGQRRGHLGQAASSGHRADEDPEEGQGATASSARSWSTRAMSRPTCSSTFIRDQIADALFDLMRWEEGELRFESDELCAEVDLGLSVPVDTVLADAEKRLEIWNKHPGQDPDRRHALRDGVRARRRSPSTSISSRANGCSCATCMTGAPSTSSSELTGYNDFETAKILYGMYSEGLIDKVGPAGEPLAE